MSERRQTEGLTLGFINSETVESEKNKSSNNLSVPNKNKAKVKFNK